MDRRLRQRVMLANASAAGLATVHVTGEGHDYWVDRMQGFSEEEQEALLDYLLSLR